MRYRDLYELTMVSLDLDFLKGRAFVEKVVARSEHVEAEAGASSATTSAKRLMLGSVNKELRAERDGDLSVHAWVQDNRRAVGCVLSAAQPVKRWHQNQNKEWRDSDRSQQWLKLQTGAEQFLAMCVR